MLDNVTGIHPLKFAKFYDITELAKKIDTSKYGEYEKVFVCLDVRDVWIARLVDGVRYEEDEGYVTDETSKILERNNLPKDSKSQGIDSLEELTEFLEADDLSNWDCYNVLTVKDAEEMLDDGFGLGELAYKY